MDDPIFDLLPKLTSHQHDQLSQLMVTILAETIDSGMTADEEDQLVRETVSRFVNDAMRDNMYKNNVLPDIGKRK